MSDAKEFLLEEYRTLTEALHVSEETGDKRLNFFYTLTSAVLGATVLFLTNSTPLSKVTGDINNKPTHELQIAEAVIVIFLIGLFAVGLIIQRRLQKRNANTDGYIEDLKRIRAIFKNSNGDLQSVPEDYSSFIPRDIKPRSRKFKSLVDIARVMNILIAGITITIAAFFFTRIVLLSLGIGTVVMAIGIVLSYGEDIWLFLYPKKSTHAGGVLYRKDGLIKFLVIRSSDKQHWVLPKGHIETGETSRCAAIREVMEETGFLGSIIKPLGRIEYSINAKDVRSDFFLMEVNTPERREKQWVTADEATKFLHGKSAQLLKTAEKVILKRRT